jgi:CRP-like cAMP-binding protein
MPGGEHLSAIPTSMAKNKASLRDVLAKQPLFRQLSGRALDRMADGTAELRVGKGTSLFSKGDLVGGFYVVVYGQVKLSLPSDHGTEKVIDLVGPGESFGEAIMFLGTPSLVSATALADALLLLISRDVVMDQIERDPVFARGMLASLSMRLHTMVKDVETYTLRSSTQRVIGYLLQYQPDDGESTNQLEIRLPASKYVIASRLNLTKETLSRIFHELSQAALINVRGKQIDVLDVAKLREYGTEHH